MRVTRWLAAVAVSVVAVPALLALAVWAWNHLTGRCGLLDEQGFACERPFTAQEARSGRITFELVREESAAGTDVVRFAVVNNTDAERSIGWHDLQLVTAGGDRARCYWGDDSYPPIRAIAPGADG